MKYHFVTDISIRVFEFMPPVRCQAFCAGASNYMAPSTYRKYVLKISCKYLIVIAHSLNYLGCITDWGKIVKICSCSSYNWQPIYGNTYFSLITESFSSYLVSFSIHDNKVSTYNCEKWAIIARNNMVF